MTRLRFAPSPTGALHIGGIRTALFNFLLARKRGGSFILRIEDTDQTRYVPGAEEYIIRSLDWLGLTPDEGVNQGGPHIPYRQSERTSIYQEHAQKLVTAGKAYLAFDTPEELEQMRERLTKEGHVNPKYDATVRMTMRNCLSLSETEVNQLKANGTPYTIRLLIEPGQEIRIEDRIRGEVIFDSTELDDKVLLKADGFPTYHLANVVDDHLMEITDVIRGEEWLPSTGHHVLLYRAFGWEDTMPAFSHLPLILKPNGQGKLSKRDGQKFGFPVFPMGWPSDNPEEAIEGFDTYGFEPEAVINFLALLGWNPGTEQEIFSIEELIEAFEPERIHKSGARFDFDKALWFNQQYIQRINFQAVESRLHQMLSESGHDPGRIPVETIFYLLQPRMILLKDYIKLGSYFFQNELHYDESEIMKKWIPDAGPVLLQIAETFSQLSAFDAGTIADYGKEIISTSGVKMGNVMPVFRAALTGTTQGPDVYAIAEILGRDETCRRIRALVGRLV